MNKDDRPVMRGTAAWAIGKIGGPNAEAALQRAAIAENDEEVLREIEKGLKLLDT